MASAAFFNHPLFARLALLVALAVAVESVWLLSRMGTRAPWSEYSSNAVSLMVGESIRFAMRGVFIGVYFAAFAIGLQPWSPGPLSAVICFVAVDLLLYLWHRLLHRTRWGWALHSVHHTGRAFSLVLAGRLPWPLRAIDDLVCLPLALLGFDPLLIYLCMAVCLTVQFLAHTSLVGRLGPIDRLLNSPSNHRVHHHTHDPDQNSNYGAAFMVWDHLFGTYRPEGAEEPIGTAEGPGPLNPLAVQWAGLRQLFRRRGSKP